MPSRIGRVESLLKAILAWAGAHDRIRAVALVGSRARGAARPDSDIDLVLLVVDPEEFRADAFWLDAIDWKAAGLSRTAWRDAQYGDLWSRHVGLDDGLEVEFGFAPLSWASCDPLNPGTKRVITDGCRVLYDPDAVRAAVVAGAKSAKLDLSGTALLSDRLSLRAFIPADAPEIFDAASPTIARFMTWDPSPSMEAFAEVWSEWVPRMAVGNELFLVARLAATGEFLGVAGLHRIGSTEPEIGIWIKQTAHGLGYGRESIAAIVKWAAAHIGATGVIYPVVEQNHPSRRLAESLHGTIVGTRKLRKSGGAVFDEVVYRIPAAS